MANQYPYPFKNYASSMKLAEVHSRQAISGLIKNGLVCRNKGQGTFVAKPGNESDSEKLNVPINSLGLLVKRTAWTSDRIFEFRMTIISKDKCHYSVELT